MNSTEEVYVQKEYNSNDLCSYHISIINENAKSKKKLPIGVIVAIVLSILAVVAVSISMSIICIKKRRKNNDVFIEMDKEIL